MVTSFKYWRLPQGFLLQGQPRGRSEVVIGNACRLSWLYCISKWILTMWEPVPIRWMFVQYVLKDVCTQSPDHKPALGPDTPADTTGGKLRSTHAAVRSRGSRGAQPRRVTHSQLEYNPYQINTLIISLCILPIANHWEGSSWKV